MEGFYSSPERTLSREAQLRSQLAASNRIIMELREQNVILTEELSLLTEELARFRSVLNFLNLQRPMIGSHIRRLEQRVSRLEAQSPHAAPPARPHTASGEARVQVILPAHPLTSPVNVQGGIASRARTPVFRFHTGSNRIEGPSSAPQ
jgi:hypothetical protein